MILKRKKKKKNSISLCYLLEEKKDFLYFLQKNPIKFPQTISRITRRIVKAPSDSVFQFRIL